MLSDAALQGRKLNPHLLYVSMDEEMRCVFK